MYSKALFVILFVLLSTVASKKPQGRKTCSQSKFKRIGCFRKNEALFKSLLVTDLDPDHHNWGQRIDWDNFKQSLHSLACRCRDKAVGKFKYFSLGFYGECWGADAKSFRRMHIREAAGTCVNGKFENCDEKHKNVCTGIEDNEYIYQVIPDPLPPRPPSKGPCHKKQIMADVLRQAGKKNVRVPTCEANGDFTWKQCTSYGRRRCWCIKNQKTGLRMPSTEVVFPHYLYMKCSKHGPDNHHKDEGACAEKWEKVNFLVQRGAKNIWIPSCDEDGNFKGKQCKGGRSCWCVEKMTGKKIPGSRRGLPKLLTMKCEESEEITIPPDSSYNTYKDKQCKKIWTREGCYNTKVWLKRGPLLVYWRYDIEWKRDRIQNFAHSLVCACADAAKAGGHKYFGTHFWGECFALTKEETLYTPRGDCMLTDGLYKTTCTGYHFRNSKQECLGIKSYSLYSL